MVVWDEVAEQGCRIGVAVAEPHGSRLAAVITEQTGVPAAVVTEAGAEAPPWIVVTPDRLGWAQAHWPADHIAVLAGSGAGDPAWAAAGMTVLTGPLPAPVVRWVQSQVVAPPVPALVWDEAPAPADAWPAAERRAPAGRGQLVAVFSSGGGVGKTTTAVYLATLAARQRQPVAVVELDEDRCGMLTYWDRDRGSPGLDTIRPAAWTDPEALAAALAKIRVAVGPRLDVFPMLGTVTGLQYPTDQVDQAVGLLTEWLRRTYAWTVCDLPARLRDSTLLAVLERADRIVWVVEPTEIMLESSRRYLDVLAQLGPLGQQMVPKIGLLVNKVEKARAARVEPAVFADALGLPLVGTIASDPVKYLSGINQHRVEPTPEWQGVAAALGMAGPPASAGAERRRRPWWRRRAR